MISTNRIRAARLGDEFSTTARYTSSTTRSTSPSTSDSTWSGTIYSANRMRYMTLNPEVANLFGNQASSSPSASASSSRGNDEETDPDEEVVEYDIIGVALNGSVITAKKGAKPIIPKTTKQMNIDNILNL